MKATIFLFWLLFITGFRLKAQVSMPDSVKSFLDKSMDIVQANSINRDSVDWPDLRRLIYQKAAGGKSYEDILLVYPYLFEQIGDHHGALKFKGKSYYWKHSAPYHNQTVIAAVKMYDTVIVKMLSGNIGYILLPGNNDFSAQHIDDDSQKIRDAIAAVDNKNVKGWIIDLRVNTGGNMYQMLAGLGNLLGDGKIGAFVNQHGQQDGIWSIRNGNIYIDSAQASKITSVKREGNKIVPIAVLISGRTASSGEVVAISFVGRKKAVLIGENSAGYTTANQGFIINKDAGLNLAIGFDADRLGYIYKGNISPNILIEGGDDFENLDNDKKVSAARKWILKTR
ncbi:S41 family peptidase [Mucilaginibacter gracilis]|nr:S41 family peptidase [Mucilaginibacter gracilis]